jgi:hypothetical protein
MLSKLLPAYNSSGSSFIISVHPPLLKAFTLNTRKLGEKSFKKLKKF